MLLLNKFTLTYNVIFSKTITLTSLIVRSRNRYIRIMYMPLYNMAELEYAVYIPAFLGYKNPLHITSIGNDCYQIKYIYDENILYNSPPCIKYSSYTSSLWLTNLESMERIVDLSSKRLYKSCLDFYNLERQKDRAVIRKFSL